MQRYLCDVIKAFHFTVFKKKEKREKKGKKQKKKKRKKEKRKRERGRGVLHNISENTRKNGGKPQLPVRDARTQGNPLRGHVTDITTGEKARLGRILRYLLLRMRTPKGTPFGITRSLPGPVRAASGHVTSGSSTSLHFAPPPQMWLCPCPYTTRVVYFTRYPFRLLKILNHRTVNTILYLVHAI